MSSSRITSLALVCIASAAPAFPLCAADAVIDWNGAALDAIRADRTSPPKASRALAITHLSIYDAINGLQRTHRPYYVAATGPVGASLDAAAAAAGYTALQALFPNALIQSTNLLVHYTTQLAGIPDGPVKTDGLAWGQTVAQAVLALRANDGSTNAVAYTPTNLPGFWRPTPPAFAPALLPGWGEVTPFVMASSSEFRCHTPPPLLTAAYAFEFNAVKAYGGSSSTLRTANQTEVALFWSDGAGTVTPPGHWNLIAQDVAQRRANTLAANARLFAMLNAALADAAICAWDAKYAYNYWRPVSAIREADTDGNPETEADPTWTPLIATPPFPEYTSGHSTFSRSAATVLAGFFGTDTIEFTSTTDGLPGVSRTYPSFTAAADDAGISRLYGGIHWLSGNLQAQAGGFMIGKQVLAYLLQPLKALQFTAIRRTGETSELELLAEPDRNYLIRASSDLKTWESVATVSSPTGQIRFSDVNAPAAHLRFYQAVAQ